MSPPTATLGPASAAPGDPELESLPAPRRPGRRLTLVVLCVSALCSLALALGLWPDARYALQSGRPVDVGNLSQISAGASPGWVRAEGELSVSEAVRYRRPLERGSYRLARAAGNDRIWVQIRVPENLEGPHFVPPSSFVGRLLPFSQAGLRYRGLSEAASGVAGETVADGWLLIDGESPSSIRWVLGLVGLFGAFTLFNSWALVRLLRPVRDG